MPDTTPNEAGEVSIAGHLTTIPENSSPLDPEKSTISTESEQQKEDDTERVDELLADFVDEAAFLSDDE